MSFFSIVLAVAFIGGSVLPYYPQYKKIKESRSSEGFSTLVSMVLLIANTVRVFYWIGARFDVTLLLQSLATIGAQLCLLKLCVEVQSGRPHVSRKRRKFMDFNLADFWQWDDFESYMQAMGTIVAALGISCVIFLQHAWFVELLGVIALGIEATLAIPQAYKNYVNKSTKGLSATLIFSWLLGDCYKTFYFLQSNSPIQFVACGTFQIISDLVVLLQLFVLYPSHEAPIRSVA